MTDLQYFSAFFIIYCFFCKVLLTLSTEEIKYSYKTKYQMIISESFCKTEYLTLFKL